MFARTAPPAAAVGGITDFSHLQFSVTYALTIDRRR
jgi:hypothetical protein